MMEVVGGFRGRVLGFVFLAVILATVILLIAGYGVAVGIGALAGFILGTFAGVASSLWLIHGPGRSMSWSSSGLQPSAELVTEMQDLGQIAGVDLGAILSIDPVLVTTEASGLTVQLLAIEHHEAGLAISLDVKASFGAVPPPWLARVTIHDDVGTQYRAAGQGSGGSHARRYDITVLPRPPTTATRLDISVDRFFDPMGSGRHEQAGPWTFSVPLDTRPTSTR